jgi:hypothetical protein
VSLLKPAPSVRAPPAPVSWIERLSEVSMFGSAIVAEANGVSVCPEAVDWPPTVFDMTGACATISAVAPAYGV